LDYGFHSSKGDGYIDADNQDFQDNLRAIRDI
jgi:hypothetical protein